MTNIFFQDVLAEQNRQKNTDGGADEIKQERILELRVDDQVANAVRHFLDDYGGGTSKESRRNAEYQHKTTIRHMRGAPCIKAVNPSVDFVFDFTHDYSRFSAAKIGKSNKRIKKKQLFPYFRRLKTAWETKTFPLPSLRSSSRSQNRD